MDASGRVSELFCLVERYFGLDRRSVLSSRLRLHSVARSALATRMRSEGYSLHEIARALERDPSTVVHLLKYTAGSAKTDPGVFPAFVGVTEAP